MKIRKRKRRKNLKYIIPIIIFSFLLILSGYKIINWFIENNKTKNIMQDIIKITNISEINGGNVIKQTEEIDENNPYWKYITMSLINVNFKELKKENNETIGWIQVNGTNINYPVVQTKNNDFYLTHSFNKKNNSAGWVFMDYRNNINTFDKNTIIYAHSRYDKTMFGSLKNILTNSWLQNDDNFVIKFSTEYENTLWQVFSVYKIITTTDYLTTTFYDNDGYQQFLDLIKNRSYFNFNTNVSVNDKIITLSTCYNNDEKIVMHAKMIKRQLK